MDQDTHTSGARWFVTGASGLLGHSLCQHLFDIGDDVFGAYKTHDISIPGVQGVCLDLLDQDAVSARVRECKPDIVVHCAGLTSVDACEENEELARILHVVATKTLGSVCEENHSKLVYISTDHLWDGTRSFVREDEPCLPLNVYGRTKCDGEIATEESCRDHLIIRTNFFGPGRPWRRSFSDWVIDKLKAGKSVPAFVNSYFTPIDIYHLRRFIAQLVIQQASGVYNVAGRSRVSKYDFALHLAKMYGFDIDLVRQMDIEDAHLKAARPSDMSLDVSKAEGFLGHEMPDLNEALETLGAGFKQGT